MLTELYWKGSPEEYWSQISLSLKNLRNYALLLNLLSHKLSLLKESTTWTPSKNPITTSTTIGHGNPDEYVATSLDVHSGVTGNVTFQDTLLAHARIELDMNTCRPLINIVKYYFTPICILYLFLKMRLSAVDYSASYFKYKTLTPIQGAPTNKTLKRLKQEL